jgi:hypothetical protein|tara:strand:- start:13310 stop:14260 length:951 start_codon:yes stop_codon:yes gene_type:complete
MDLKRLLTSLSSQILVQLAIVVGLIIIGIGWNFQFIFSFYFENQQTPTGIIINSFIVALFFFGMINVVYHLLRYRKEEKSIAGLANNIESLRTDLMHGLVADSIVAKRYWTLKSIQKVNGEINHSALSAMLTADESTKFGLIRYINNILILTGVFGTIVSLSIALLGASDLIDSAAGSLGGMGLVIHGMSTALSTTITAIVSYVLFGYFYTRLNDVQTHFLSGVEQLTSIYLLPQFVPSGDDIVHKMTDLIKSVVFAANNLKKTQEIYHESATSLQETINMNRTQIEGLSAELMEIKLILRDGFRLPQPLPKNDFE